MYDRVMTLIAACLYYSGWVALGRWWMQRQGTRLMILNYHTATEGDLRQYLLYLWHHYRLLHLENAPKIIVPIDSPAWYAWLEQAHSFPFRKVESIMQSLVVVRGDSR